MTSPLHSVLAALAALALLPAAAPTAAWAQSEWDGVERVVVIGDLEGDDVKFDAMLRDAGLADENGDWIGGEAHLVQIGDIPDRGPHSRAIMDHLMKLERQARRAGGMVHALIGNHETMNMLGDLRYTDPGEFAAFADRRSQRRQDQYYEQTLAYLRANPPPEGLPAFDDAYRAQWEAQFPLGYVEHRLGWAAEGEYGRWVSGHDSVIRINDTLYLHAGLGPTYVDADRDDMNRAVQDALHGEPDADYPTILDDEDGPLWYRGLALNAEDAERAHLEALLARQGVKRIVVGHTKVASTVLPRFDGQVIITDIAVPEGYEDPYAYLIVEGDTLTTVHRGHRVPLAAGTHDETCAYLAEVAALDPPGSPVARTAAECEAE
jgi:hypothetical protein